MISTTEQQKIKELLAEKNRREMMAIRLYRPMPSQVPFHMSRASERIVTGGVRGGKTTSAVLEVASAALGIPLTAPDGTTIPNHYPKRPLLIWVIGYNETHIATIYKYLFRPGMFKIIRDKADGRWRSWNPSDPADLARESETKQSPPLIPEEYVKEWAWVNKAGRIFGTCRLTNGTEIRAFTSAGQPGKGVPVDVIWIDEDIEIPSHVEEWQSRLSDVRGRLIWSAWPHDRNVAIGLMRQRATDQLNRVNPDVQEFVLAFSKNPYIPIDEKRKRLEGWAAAGEAVLRSRDLGESSRDLQRVYPAFDIAVHGTPRKAGPDELELALAANDWVVPAYWTRYLALDPGHANAAVVFGAVPPPEIGKFLLIYDEVFAQRCDAEALASMVAEKAMNTTFHAFIIDAHAGRQTVMGGGKRVIEFYREAFENFGLKSTLTEFGFLPGSDDIQARNMVVRGWMNLRSDKTTHLRLITDRTPYMQREIAEYRQTITRDEMTDKPIDRKNHLMDALGYMAAYLAPLFDYDAAYYKPDAGSTTLNSTLKAYEKIAQNMSGVKNDGSFNLGAGTARSAA